MQTKTKLKIDFATHVAAKFACERWHYSRRLPSTLQKRFAVGVWEESIFKGVVVFGHGANPAIGAPYGLSIYQVCELTRVALSPDHKSEVSKVIRFALKFLKKYNPQLRLVVSYADTGQGHHGGIYQAGNWIYVGLSKGVPQLFFKGRVWHAKAFRTSHKNIKHSDPRIKKIEGTDKHKYLMPLDQEIKKKIQSLSKKYPKRVASLVEERSALQPIGGGAIPTATLQLLGDDGGEE